MVSWSPWLGSRAPTFLDSLSVERSPIPDREGAASNVAIRPVRCFYRLGDYVVGPADIKPGRVASYCSSLMSSESLCRSVHFSGAEPILLIVRQPGYVASEGG